MPDTEVKSTKKNWRNRLFEVIEVAEDGDRLSNVYDVVMMITIVASIVPMAFKTTNTLFDVIDKVAVVIFILDYLLRLVTADLKLKKGLGSFFLYPITPMALIDLAAILPSVIVVNGGLKLLKVFRLLRTLRVLRVFKVVRYSTPIQMILGIFKRTKESLLFVCGIAVGYVLIAALVVFNVEPDTFKDFFDAIYWATVSLTTMGYGDIYPVTMAGKIVTMISSFMGIAIVALPSGIITTGLMEELNESKANKKTEDSN